MKCMSVVAELLCNKSLKNQKDSYRNNRVLDTTDISLMVWPVAVMMSQATSQVGVGHFQGEIWFYSHNICLK